MPALVAMMYVVLLAAFAVGAVALGVYALVEGPAWMRRRLAAPADAGRGAGAPRPSGALAYPERLAALEERLVDALEAARTQAVHLRARGERMRGERPDLADRYDADAAMLDRRAERLEGLLSSVWRTRAVLWLRARLALEAREAPSLDGLPDADAVPVDGLERAARAYEEASGAVRAFARGLRGRAESLHLELPAPPAAAGVREEDRAAVAEEVERARRTCARLALRLEHLADTLAYLGDRCRTRLVVHGAGGGLEADEGAAARLVDEVSAALAALDELAEAGERRLAEADLDGLAEGVDRLERAGDEARLEAEAALEVERLLERIR